MSNCTPPVNRQDSSTHPKTPTDPEPQVDPARLLQCIGAAVRILRGDQSLTVKLVRKDK